MVQGLREFHVPATIRRANDIRSVNILERRPLIKIVSLRAKIANWYKVQEQNGESNE